MQYGLDSERSVRSCVITALHKYIGALKQMLMFRNLQPHTHMSWRCEPKLRKYEKLEPGKKIPFCTHSGSQ